MNKLSIATIALIALTATGYSQAETMEGCGNAPKSDWMSEADITAKAVEMGYEISNVKEEDGCYELYARKDGKKMEVFMNPVTGEVVKVK
jgi:hypothetical protein